MTWIASHPIKSLAQTSFAATLLVLATSACSQGPATAPVNPPAKEPAFDVVSIRPHKDNGNYSHWWTATADGYQAYNVPVFELIFAAYGLKCPGQLIGLPQWGHEDSYDIDARIDDPQAAALQRMSNVEQLAYAAPRLRSVLADRFQLKVHPETKVLPVYELVVAKGGFKLKQADGEANLGGMNTNRGLIHVPRGPIGARFIVGLSNATGRIVVDKTGLTGYYDIELKWTPDEDLAAGVSGPTLFTALEEQLGLKLVSNKAPVDVLVVDHVERPSEN